MALNLIRAFGDLTLRELRPSLIAAHKAKRRAEGAAAKTLHIELGILSHAFQLAVKEWEWVTENPVIRVSREKVRNVIERWLTGEEEWGLLAVSPTCHRLCSEHWSQTGRDPRPAMVQG